MKTLSQSRINIVFVVAFVFISFTFTFDHCWIANAGKSENDEGQRMGTAKVGKDRFAKQIVEFLY